jgi:phosphoglucomutase
LTDCKDFQLDFGTGGLRGVLGDGPGRMNPVTVGRAAQGTAAWLNAACPSGTRPLSAVVACDTRRMSREFAERTARVFSGNGIECYLFPRPVPTPALSFAVRALRAGAGVCITASHNPAEYNGYKVYGADGGQITLRDAEAIAGHIREGAEVKTSDTLVKTVPETVLPAYLDAVEALRLTKKPCDNLKVAYTPLNGAGLECVTEILRRLGAECVVVPEQAAPDGAFPTCPRPNPEEEDALELGLRLCLEQGCDLLLATDPDCDRVGVAVSRQGTIRRLSGNEVGVLLLEYILRSKKEAGSLPGKPVAVKTVVTTPMARAVCDRYGAELRDVLTGFKYIGEQIGRLERDGEAGRFVFGFEESCGYLSGVHARDKDAVNAAMLVCELAADCKRRGVTLADAIEELYGRYGRWTTRLRSVEAAPEAVGRLRQNPPETLGGHPVLKVTDYLDGIGGLPPADMLSFELEGGTVVIRPSGTEPKVKVYTMVRGIEYAEIDAGLQRLYLGRDTP